MEKKFPITINYQIGIKWLLKKYTSSVMKKVFFICICCCLFISCRLIQVDYTSSGTYLLDNQSSYDVIVVVQHKLIETADTSKLIQVGALDTIFHIHTDPSHHTPWMFDYIKIFQCIRDTEMVLLYEQNPINESLWIVEPQYNIEKDYGHTLNTFVFTDSLIQR